MEINNIEVYGFGAALRGMRNPLDSWDKSDSIMGEDSQVLTTECFEIFATENYRIGPEDMKLACKLIKGGSEHRKFLRQIQIFFDISNPIFIWSEFDTYKVATVRNSCSTMHTLGLRDLTQDDFELGCDEDYLVKLNKYGEDFRQASVIRDHKEKNRIRHEYKNALPCGFLQKATYTMSYETALSMYFQRKGHRLPEWNAKEPGSICSMIASLPYMKKFIDARR